MIKKAILSLCLSFGLVFPVWAEDENVTEENAIAEQVTERTPQAEPQEQIAETEQTPEIAVEQDIQEKKEILEDADISLNKEKKPEFEVVYQVEKNLQTLPACSDEKLQISAKEYIKKYLDETLNQGTIFRRHKYFVLHNLDKFAEENIADYKTAATSPVSDMIAHAKMNKGIIEENMRLCKNTSANKYAGKIFLLIYPEDENNYRVNVINLARTQIGQSETTFTYAK